MKNLSIKLLVGLFVLAFPSWPHAQVRNTERVRIGYSGIGITYDLLKLMENAHIFENHGLSAQNIYIASGSLMNQAIVAGSIDFTTSDLPSQIEAAIAGIDFKVISVTINRLDGAIVTRKEIRKPQDLKGKKLAISRFGSVSDIVTRMVLRHWNLEPVKDVALIQVGNTPSRIAAIMSGQIDGGLINPTDVDRIMSAGCCFLLADLSALDIPYARFGVTALAGFLKTHAQTARNLIEAFVEGIYYYKSHPEEAIASLRARGADPGGAKAAYQKVAASYRSRPDPDLSGIQGVLDSLPDERAKKVRPESLIEPGPWDRVSASGYVERLYGKK